MTKLTNEELIERIENVEKQLSKIKSRNTKVELDKAWEGSKTRILFLLVFTYFLTLIVFWLISAPNPLFNAVILTIAYITSIQSLPIVKKWWLSNK